jgi:hypothetical protein
VPRVPGRCGTARCGGAASAPARGRQTFRERHAGRRVYPGPRRQSRSRPTRRQRSVCLAYNPRFEIRFGDGHRHPCSSVSICGSILLLFLSQQPAYRRPAPSDRMTSSPSRGPPYVALPTPAGCLSVDVDFVGG